MSKSALIEIGIGVAAIAAAFIPGIGPALSVELISLGASMAAGGIISGVASLLMSDGGISGAMRNPIGAHNYQFGNCSVAGTTVFLTANSNTGGGTTSDDKQLHIVRVLNAHPSLIGSSWQLYVGGKPCVMTPNGPGYLSVSPTQLQISISTISRSGGLVTLKLSSGLANANGTTVYVKNVADTTYNCICTVTQPNPADNTTFTYVCGGANGSSTGGVLGTAYEDVGGRVYVEFLNGNHTSTFSTLLSSGTQWGPTDLWLGRTLMYLQLGYDASDFGSIPDIRLVSQGNNMIYDPRTSTYGYTNNSALCIAYYLNLPRVDGGFGLQYGTDINTAQLIAAANICDEAVPLAAGGTVARYTCNGNVEVSRGRGTILQELLSSCAGRISFSGGQYSIFPGAWVAPSLSFTTADFVGPVDFQVLLSARDIANGAKGTYTSPANNWQQADIPPYLQDTNHGYSTNQFLIDDNNESIYLLQNLPFTTDPATAQRLLKIAMMRTRFQSRVTARLSMKAFKCTPLDVITLTHAKYGWSSAEFEVLSETIMVDVKDGNPRLYMELNLALTDSSVYDWSTSEELSATGYVQPDNMGGTRSATEPNALSLYSGPGATIGGVVYPNTVSVGADGISRNSLYVQWVPPNDPFVTSGGKIEVQYQLNGASVWTNAGTPSGITTNLFIPGVSDGQQYNVRIRSINVAGAYSEWVAAGPETLSSVTSSISVAAISGLTLGVIAGTLAATKVTGLASVATTGVIAASAITSGTLPSAALPTVLASLNAGGASGATVAAGATAQVGTGATASVTGTGLTGKITLATGTGSLTAGTICTLTFPATFAAAPNGVCAANGTAIPTLGWSTSTTQLTITVVTPLTPSTTYTIEYAIS